MAFVHQHLGSILLLTVATLPLIGLTIYAELAQTRSAADLAVADRCMEWSHENAGTQLKEGADLAE